MGCVGGRLMASPLSRGSGVVSSFMKADGILEVPQGLEGYEAGEEVSVRLLSPLEKLHNTLVIIGSMIRCWTSWQICSIWRTLPCTSAPPMWAPWAV